MFISGLIVRRPKAAYLALDGTESRTGVVEGFDEDVLRTFLPVLPTLLQLLNAICSGSVLFLLGHCSPACQKFLDERGGDALPSTSTKLCNRVSRLGNC